MKKHASTFQDNMDNNRSPNKPIIVYTVSLARSFKITQSNKGRILQNTKTDNPRRRFCHYNVK